MTIPVTEFITTAGGASTLHTEIQRFYARQMQAMDSGEVETWAATFTPDGVFASNAFPQPTCGRAALAAAARHAATEAAAAGLVRRHWLGMLTVEPREDGSVFARSYALVIITPHGGAPELSRSTVCEDVLVPDGDSWLVRERSVNRDDL
jgi:hypothetical protein